MPVARIISSSFEDALKFADYLRPLFDTVEIAQPGRAYKTAVDLEVNLELCTPEQAWQQIAQAGAQPETEVFVAPGTLFAEPGHAPDAADVAVEIQPEAATDATRQELEDASRDLDAAIAHASSAAVVAAGSNGSGTHKPAYAEAAPEHELNWLGRVRESLRQWLAVRALLREIHEMEEQRLAAEQQRQRQMALRFERERREKEMQQFAAAPLVRQPAAEVQEAEQQQATPEAVSGVEEEILRRQAEEEEAIRRGIFVEQILSRRAQEQAAETAIENAPEVEAVPVEFQAVPAESFAEPPALTPVRSFSRTSARRLRPAMALAGVTSVLLMAVLMGYAHRRPASPLPLAALQRSEVVQQKVPFGAAVVSSPNPAPESEPVAVPLETASISVAVPERHDFRDDFHRVRVDNHEVDYVSNDVTVRHFIYKRPGSLVPHPSPAVHIMTSGGVKQISDLQ